MITSNISVALCAYNGSKHILQQLESIVNQSLVPTEIIVCDDKSNDNTCELVESFQALHPGLIKLYKNPTTLGRNKNFEKAISLCAGDIIALSDQDDVFLPKKFELIADVFKQHSDCGLVFSDACVVDEYLKDISPSLFSIMWPPFTLRRKTLLEQGKVFDVLVRTPPTIGCSMAFRSDLRKHILPIPEEFSHDFWILLLSSVLSGIRFIDKSLLLYRQHESNLSGIQKSVLKRLRMRMTGNPNDYYDSVHKSRICWEDLKHKLMNLLEEGAISRERANSILHIIDSKINYLKTREIIATKESGFIRRVALVSYLFFSLNYLRYGRGAYSILRDATVTFLRLRGSIWQRADIS